MLKMPIGVQEIVGNPPTLQPVLAGAWKYFCLKTDADALCVAINQTFGLDLKVIEDGEAPVVFVYQSSDPNGVPKVWSIVGQDAAGNEIYESAAWILDRRYKPAFGIDKNLPASVNGPVPVLKMNFATMYGIAEFFWSAN